ncbi:unnamed protein product [Adineta steineri]|uniref:EF-hand domain-containing protein n=1 Tax=Adineta steineri TaxID=433720 RepID=A0A814SJH8_9BILA|nr:unnamed protein product [Adineta steineri]
MPRGHGKLSKTQMKELRDAFDMFDRDQSGSISSSELKQLLIALNFKPTENLLRKVMREMDADGNGTIEFDEFVKVMGSVYARKLTDDEMQRAFKCFDKDDSGFITIEELRDVLRQLNQNTTEKQLKDMVNQLDEDHDGKISYDEFVHMLQGMS